jgi:hypothetical protein
MLHYIIQTIGFQLFFLVVFEVFLKKETFFNWNRVYLLGTSTLSLLLPFIKIEGFKGVISKAYIINLPEVIIGQQPTTPDGFILKHDTVVNQSLLWSWEFILYLGVALALLLFTFKLAKIIGLLLKNPKQKLGKLYIVDLKESTAAFSFLNFVFLGTHLKPEEKSSVLKHETIHVKQKHTLDLLFFECLRIVFWFNPLIYIYQNRIMSLHEFIADDQASKHQNKHQYYQNLLARVFETNTISFINPFYKKSLIKKRIIMLQKTKSKQIKLLKYTLLFPMVFGMLIYTSSIEAKNVKETGYNIETKTNEETPLTKKIRLVYEQIQKQGNISADEEKGLTLLLKTIKGEEFSQKLVDEVVDYTSQANTSELCRRISNVFEQIQIQGNISDEEHKELKKLLVLSIDDGFENPFFADIIKYVDIPFAIIDQVPLYPGCESIPVSEQKKCMAMNISKHVNSNFNVKLANELKLSGRQRISVIFKINTEGNVVDVRSRAEHPGLEKEAIRVINTLPKFTPGEHKGKKVNVPYALPIIFAIAEKNAKD